jgi:hypothetical protein
MDWLTTSIAVLAIAAAGFGILIRGFGVTFTGLVVTSVPKVPIWQVCYFN